ncbi:protein of unknown function [Pseudodesulfovibrio piezophilus C1TLV30]|uniref:Uncharacterized protein n=1 Tax=Pseudodesulfovibrio piezophilus (strain DSM 21447 / JCM 15486 / C1TLV30) TaxID=1322246 RepID=M1WVT2_PSEP2|nr:protein of unknown function [Pseudodesulfovibrio piezophilus C1TLV30]
MVRSYQIKASASMKEGNLNTPGPLSSL